MKIPVRLSLTVLAIAFASAKLVIAADAVPGFPASNTQTPRKNEKATGPYVWKNATISGTGFVPRILFHPKAPGLVYARTDIGGAYRWNPTETRWIPLLDWVGKDEWWLLGIESIGLDIQNPKRVYIAAGMYTNDWCGNGAILRSVDQGATWKKTPLPFKLGSNMDGRSIGEKLVVDPNLGSRLLLGTRHNGLWISEDYGKTWKQEERFPVGGKKDGLAVGLVLFDVARGKQGVASPTIYASLVTTGTNLYRSNDAGASWQEVAGQPRDLIPHQAALTPEGILYITYANKPGPNDATNGAVWKLDTTTGKWTEITPLKPGVDGETAYGYAGLTVDPRNSRVLMVSTLNRWGQGDDIFRSTDGGSQWKGVAQNATNDASASPFIKWDHAKIPFGHWIGALAMNPFNNREVIYATGDTVWATNDVSPAENDRPTEWKICAQGIEESAVMDLFSPPGGPHLISAILDVQGFRHEDFNVSPQGDVWLNPKMNHVYAIDFAQKNPQLVVRVGDSRECRGGFSTDGAKTWQPFGSEPDPIRDVRDRSLGIAIAADGGAFVWVAPDGIAYASHDQGNSWQPCKGLSARPVVVADRVNPKVFYALSSQDHTLLVSKDAGQSFVVAGRNLPNAARQLRALPSREGELWLTAYGDGLWYSNNGGASFTKLRGVDASESVGFGKAALGKDYEAIYMLGTVSNVQGVFRSDDKGSTWKRINDDQHRYGSIGPVITGDPRIYGRVYFATNGRGIVYGDPVGP